MRRRMFLRPFEGADGVREKRQPPAEFELLLKVQLVTVGDAWKLHMPPLLNKALAELLLKVQLVTVGDER